MENLLLVRCYSNAEGNDDFEVGKCYMVRVTDSLFYIYLDYEKGIRTSRNIKGALSMRLFFYESNAFIECFGYIWKIISSVSSSEVCNKNKLSISLEEAKDYL